MLILYEIYPITVCAESKAIIYLAECILAEKVRNLG